MDHDMFSQLGWAWERWRTVPALVWSIGGLEKSTEFILFNSLMSVEQKLQTMSNTWYLVTKLDKANPRLIL